MPTREREAGSPEDGEIDLLYRLPPERFTAARDSLAKKLKEQGNDQAASAVRALKKPTTLAWAVNQLAAKNPEQVDALLEAGTQVRKAHWQALSGQGAEALRDAIAAEREALGALLDRVESGERVGRDKIRATLLAAAHGSDEDREMLRAGRLTRELSVAGFVEVTGTAAPPPPREAPPMTARERQAAEREEKRRRLAAERAMKAEQRDHALTEREAARQRAAAEWEEKRRRAQAERALQRLRQRVRAAEERTKRLAEAAEAAEQQAAKARAWVTEAEKELEQLRRELQATTTH
jgi:hypothetical protein